MEEENKIRKILFNEISFVIAVVGAVIGIFIFLTDPTTDNEIALKLQDARITEQQNTIDNLTKTQQNDIKEMKSEVSGLRVEVQVLTNCITKLQTIIEERIPKTL